MPDSCNLPPSIDTRMRGDALVVAFAGDWKLAADVPRVAALSLEGSTGQPTSIVVDTDNLGAWDSALLVYIINLRDRCAALNIDLNLDALPPSAVRLLTLADAVPEKASDCEHCDDPNVRERVGQFCLAIFRDVTEMLAFVGECTAAMLRLCCGKARMRRQDFLNSIQDCGPHALPIVTLISFLVGLIIAFLGAVVLKRMAAEFYVSYIVGYGILREMGALMVGIIMAGRTGAAFAAEIGSMKVSEELDALRTLGISPIEFVVLPRLTALVLMMPLLTLYADLIGVGGGWFIAVATLDISHHQFFSGMIDVVGMADLVMGLVKSVVFGVVVAFSGCLRGMHCENRSDAVGAAATRAVVTSITLITITNALIDGIATLYGI